MIGSGRVQPVQIPTETRYLRLRDAFHLQVCLMFIAPKLVSSFKCSVLAIITVQLRSHLDLLFSICLLEPPSLRTPLGSLQVFQHCGGLILAVIKTSAVRLGCR